MRDKIETKSWRTWLIPSGEDEILVRETFDRSRIVLEVRHRDQVLASISMNADAWDALCDLRYHAAIDRPRDASMTATNGTAKPAQLTPLGGL